MGHVWHGRLGLQAATYMHDMVYLIVCDCLADLTGTLLVAVGLVSMASRPPLLLSLTGSERDSLRLT
jgi:hypothetical protein